MHKLFPSVNGYVEDYVSPLIADPATQRPDSPAGIPSASASETSLSGK